MAKPPFLLQIVDADGVVVRTRAGGKHEVDLVELFVISIMRLGVGLGRTSAHVEADIRKGITIGIQALKITNPFDVVE